MPFLLATAGCGGGAHATNAWTGTVDTVGDTEVVTTTVPPLSAWPPIDTARGVVRVWQSDSLDRPSAIVTDSRNRLLVADRAQTFLLTDSGQVLGMLGRRGRGPGEFQAIRGLGVLPDDRVVVWDGVEQRLTWFSQGGQVMRTSSVTGLPPFTDARRVTLAPLGTGVILAWGFSLVRPNGPPDSVALVYHPWDSLTPQTLAVIEDISWVNGGQMLGPHYPFGPRALYAVSRSGLFAYTTGVDYCVTVRRATGGGARRICREWIQQPVDGASRMPDDTSGVGRAGTGLAGVLARQEFGSRKNSIDEIHFDDQDRLWVRVVDGSQRHHPMYMARLLRLRPRYYVWDVFSPMGRLERRVALPSQFRPLLFLAERLYGVLEDESGALSVARVDLQQAAHVAIRSPVQ